MFARLSSRDKAGMCQKCVGAVSPWLELSRFGRVVVKVQHDAILARLADPEVER